MIRLRRSNALLDRSMTRTTYRPRWVLLAFTSIILLISAADTGFAQCPEPPPYVFFPLNWPCPVIPTCSTQSGVCLWPNPGAPGQPCYCQAPNGVWIPGVIIRGGDHPRCARHLATALNLDRR